ncbi:MAG: hypothetical protein HY985_07965 [Magnetospirillum sp.]|nr:hypothetical protein [Magnetospirillum sp.]
MPPRPAEQAALVRRINATLQGPVVDALADIVPDVAALPRRAALEAILDDLGLLERCFAAFRANPDGFRDLLIDRHRVPVETADALLECGRSLDEVVAMIVRTAAKRHFRRRLDDSSRPLRLRHRKGKTTLLDRLLALLALSDAPRAQRSRGEILYDAFKALLLHDWQVPLVAEYATLSPRLVQRLGVRLLDYRLAADIHRLKLDPAHPPPPTEAPEPTPLWPPAPAQKPKLPQALTGPGNFSLPALPPARFPASGSTARDERARLDEILTADGRLLKAAAFGMELIDPSVRGALLDPGATVKITEVLTGVGAMTAKMLVGELGLTKAQLAVLLVTAHDILGQAAFLRAFGLPGRPDYLAKLVQRARLKKIAQTTPLADIAGFVRESFLVDKSR